MKTINNIGLDNKASQNTALKLNDLLSNYQVFYMNYIDIIVLDHHL